MGAWGEIIGGPKVWARDLGIAVFVGLSLAFIGPFGSYDRPLDQRLLICIGYVISGSVVFWPTLRALLRLGARAGLPPLFSAVVGLVVAAVPVAMVVHVVSPILSAPGSPRSGMTLYLAVLALALPLGLAVLMADRWAAASAHVPPIEPEGAASSEPRLFARLPGRLGREILALQAEDHYVRVHTALGSDLILMRMADAIAEADGIAGQRVHRSWWVAAGAVASARAEGRRAVLTLTNGLIVPVTRDAVPDIRRAGWL